MGAFIILTIAGGVIFKLSSLKDIFYIPMQEFLGLSHTEIGAALSVYGAVQIIGNFFSIYISDRFSRKGMISFSLGAVGLTGLYLSTFPSYKGILFCFGIFSFFEEVIFWPVLLKSIRLLGESGKQGRLFGFLETGRGVVDTLVAFLALGIFSFLGKGSFAFKVAIIFLSLLIISVGIITFFILDDSTSKNEINKNRIAWDGMVRAIKTREIWMVSLLMGSIYSIYCGLTYFIPFLKEVYRVPVTLVGIYGIINQYGLKMFGGVSGGFLADKKFHSPIRFLRFALILSGTFMGVILFLPHEEMSLLFVVPLLLIFSLLIFSMRGVYFAPIDEIGVPIEITGAAMSIVCLLGYAPQAFAFVLYGSILDTFPGLLGYKIIFAIMISFSLIGVWISTLLSSSKK